MADGLMSKPAKFSRRVILNPIAVAMEGSRLLPKEAREGLQKIIADSLADFRAARDCRAQWANMADALNIAEGLADVGICADQTSRERIVGAQAVLSAVWKQAEQLGTWSLRAAEFQALDDGLWLARVQLDHCSRREYERATEAVRVRTVRALSGNAAPGTVIVGAINRKG
jgi:hypothetical protein